MMDLMLPLLFITFKAFLPGGVAQEKTQLIFLRIPGAGLSGSCLQSKRQEPTSSQACSNLLSWGGREGPGARQGGKVHLAQEQEAAASRESFAELSSRPLGSDYRCHAAVNVLSAAGTWERRVRLS